VGFAGLEILLLDELLLCMKLWVFIEAAAFATAEREIAGLDEDCVVVVVDEVVDVDEIGEIPFVVGEDVVVGETNTFG